MPRLQSSLSDVSVGDILPHVIKSSRSHEVHLDYAAEGVKLAFGRTASGRIAHVSQVERGLDCNCICPSCDESLVARQGDVKSWHFAHSSGSACKGAFSAALATLLADLLNQGSAFSLPHLTWKWGSSDKRRATGRVIMENATTEVDPRTGLHYVIALPTTSHFGARFRISFLEPGMAQDATSHSEDETCHLLLDFTQVEDLGLPEDAIISAVSDRLLASSDRRWIYHHQIQSERRACTEKYLRRHLDAYADLDDSQLPHRCEDLARKMGFGAAIETSPISGEAYLAPSATGWRAAILCEVVLTPALCGRAEMPLSEVAFGHREITRAMARERLVRSPALMQPLDHDSTMELGRIIPDLQRPIQVVEAYLHQLWALGIVKAKPRTRPTGGAAGQYDVRLAGLPSQGWIMSESALAQVRRSALSRP
jgi:hypothetical protein